MLVPKKRALAFRTLATGLAIEIQKKLGKAGEIPEKGSWEKWQSRATTFPWILRQTGLYCWENSEMPKSTESQGTWSRLWTYYPSLAAKVVGTTPDSSVRITGFCFIYATSEKFNHLLSLSFFIWRKWDKTIRLVVRRWEVTLIYFKNLPRSRFLKSDNSGN